RASQDSTISLRSTSLPAPRITEISAKSPQKTSRCETTLRKNPSDQLATGWRADKASKAWLALTTNAATLQETKSSKGPLSGQTGAGSSASCAKSRSESQTGGTNAAIDIPIARGEGSSPGSPGVAKSPAAAAAHTATNAQTPVVLVRSHGSRPMAATT